MMQSARAVLIWLWVGVLAALVILTVVLVYATRRLVGKPVQQLSAALGFLSQGDLMRSVDIRSNDEIGALGQAMEGFRQRLDIIPALRLRQPQFFTPVFTHEERESLRRGRHAVILTVDIAGTLPCRLE